MYLCKCQADKTTLRKQNQNQIKQIRTEPKLIHFVIRKSERARSLKSVSQMKTAHKNTMQRRHSHTQTDRQKENEVFS